MQVTKTAHKLANKAINKNIFIWLILLLFNVLQVVHLVWTCLYDFGRLKDEINYKCQLRKEELR